MSNEMGSGASTGKAVADAKAPRRVPKFDSSWDRPEMNRLQKSFYRRTFLPSLLAGDPVDVQGQPGYGEVLLYELLNERRTNPVEARRTLESLVKAYRGDDLPLYAESTLADFYFLEGDFASGHAALGTGVSPSLHLTIAAHLEYPPLTAWQVLRWYPGGLTQKGMRNYWLEIMDALQTRLDDFHAAHGVSFLVNSWQRVTAERPAEEVAADIEDEVVQRLTGQLVRHLLSAARENGTSERPLAAFQRWPEYEEPIDWPEPWVTSNLHAAILYARFRALLREAENAARDQAGTPRIGEGLVSEMELLRQVRAAFPEERVVHQARPGWLAPQSLDIYLPDYNIGIEYQGAQHSAPVDFFGGTEAFERQQERDALKQDLCREYGCVLIEVHPGYQFEHVIAQVRDAIRNAADGSSESLTVVHRDALQ